MEEIPVKHNHRGEWSNQFESFLVALAYVIGLGNFWRFPYLMYANGGAIYLIPYTIWMIFLGFPMVYLELSLGQLFRAGPMKVFGTAVPIMHGIGVGTVFVAFGVAIYYNVITSWMLIYVANSFSNVLPWSLCNNTWNTLDCYSHTGKELCQLGYDVDGVYHECFNSTFLTSPKFKNEKREINTLNSAEIEFFENHLLRLSDGLGTHGKMQWKVVLALAIAWVTVFLCLIRGVKSLAKVAYLLVGLPYVALVILFLRGTTLPGAREGIMFYISPDLNRLWDVSIKFTSIILFRIWYAAMTDVFYTLGIGFGCLTTISSYNKSSNNCFRDAILLVFMNYATSVFAGFVVFTFTGFLAYNLGVEISEVANSGLFVVVKVIPEAISNLSSAPIWSMLFFLMVVILAIGNQVCVVFTVITAVIDQFTSLQKYQWLIALVSCFICFTLGISLCYQSGFYYFLLLDNYLTGYGIILLSLLQAFTATWIYGIGNLFKDLRNMIGYSTSCFSRVFGGAGYFPGFLMTVTSPLILGLMLIMTLISYTRPNYGEYFFPDDAETVGFIISTMAWIFVPVFMIIKLTQYLRQGKPLIDLLHPDEAWKKQMEYTAVPA